MTDTPTAVAIAAAPPRPRFLDWLPVLSALAIVFSAVWAGGGYVQALNEHSRRIETLEKKDELLRQVDLRTARIEAKLEVLTSDRQQERVE